jgi:actin-related protein 4
VSAIVIDQGSNWTRIGFGGEDTPKGVIPTYYGRTRNADYDQEVLPDTSERNEAFRYFFGDNNIFTPRAGLEIETPITNGIVTDWDANERLWKYCLDEYIVSDLSEHPLLITEQIWNTDENRIKAMELAFETFDFPAFYIAKRPVCSLFASGKGSGLVVDVGAKSATVTPIIDGLALFKRKWIITEFCRQEGDEQGTKTYEGASSEASPEI